MDCGRVQLPFAAVGNFSLLPPKRDNGQQKVYHIILVAKVCMWQSVLSPPKPQRSTHGRSGTAVDRRSFWHEGRQSTDGRSGSTAARFREVLLYTRNQYASAKMAACRACSVLLVWEPEARTHRGLDDGTDDRADTQRLSLSAGLKFVFVVDEDERAAAFCGANRLFGQKVAKKG